MKNSVFVAAIAACALSASVVSAQEIYPPSQPARTDKAMNMDMGKHMPPMQANMEKMKPQMDKIRATSDPKERQQLMREHMQSMHDNMKMMHSMGGPMMMSGDQASGMKMADKKGTMTQGDMMKRHAMMEQRMDMMQMMMEQMMQHHQAMEPMPAK
jgi:hypothetical protein